MAKPITMVEFARSYDLDGPGGDYFSAACALHWYCVDYHGGQWSELYAIQCRLEYRPGMSESGPEPDSTDAAIYAALEVGELAPGDVETWINQMYQEANK